MKVSGSKSSLSRGLPAANSSSRRTGPIRDVAKEACHGSFRRLWNAKPEARKLAKGIPSAQFWASDPGGFHQVGCVYTAQGFEFEIAGVIWGADLVIRDGVWVGQPSAPRDTVVRTRSGGRFTDIVKNAYRVLLTRGMRGCYLCILDDETRRTLPNV